MPDRLPAICFVAPNAFPVLSGDKTTPLIGGAELQQVIVARALAERGYPVSMICRDFGQRDKVEIDGIRILKAFRLDAGVPVVRFFWPRLTSIWRCLSNANADIYYQRTAGMLTGIVAVFCRRAGKKSIFAAAGNPDLEPGTSRIKHGRDRWIYEYGLRNVDRILVQNEEQERLCRLNFGRDATCVPNCYPFVRDRLTNAGRFVLWVSTIRGLKRPELFLDLAEALPQYRFRMIGGPGRGEQQLYDSTRIRAESIANVEFFGFMPYSQVDDYFDDAAVFVNTSESEGFPNTFLQAWARGVPTVSFIDSGARAAGQTVGRQVESIATMVQQVANWLSDESERSRVGRICRKYVDDHHSPARVLALYEQVFSELLPGHAG